MRRLIALVALAGLTTLGLTAVRAPAGGVIPISRVDGRIAFSGICCWGSTVDPDGSNLHVISPEGSVFCFTWSPDGTKLLCNVVEGDPDGSTFSVLPATVNPDGSGLNVLHPALSALPCNAWSPDGTRLLCHTDFLGAENGIYTIRASDGRGMVRLTAPPAGFFEGPQEYSPDGTRILFWRHDESTCDAFPFCPRTLYSVRTDGSGLITLTPPSLDVVDEGFFDNVNVDYSPDGSRVVFAANFFRVPRGATAIHALFVVNSDGSGLHQITHLDVVRPWSAQWSPDGTRIAFEGMSPAFPAFQRQVWLIHPDGTGPRRVTSPARRTDALAPIWSPSGSKLLFQQVSAVSSSATPQVDLYSVNVDGTDLARIAALPDLSLYSWGAAPTE